MDQGYKKAKDDLVFVAIRNYKVNWISIEIQNALKESESFDLRKDLSENLDHYYWCDMS